LSSAARTDGRILRKPFQHLNIHSNRDRIPIHFPSEPLFTSAQNLYSHPRNDYSHTLESAPDKAIVLSVDEKSPIQALDRTQPILPLRPGLPARRTYDYQRHGTTTLFAALNVLEGTVIGSCLPKHRHQEFLQFLDRIDQSVESDPEIHLVLDNYGTHKHPAVKKWLAARPRYHVHFTPTSSSWLNQIERWFAEITRKRIRRGTFRSVRDLTRAIQDYIRLYNQNPQPFQWVATASRIIRKVRKYKEISVTGD
jgi:transposase